MQVTRKNLSPTKVNLVISADQYDLTPIKDHTLGHFSDTVKVPGFREGTAPPALVEKYANPQSLTDEFMQHALNDLYGKAVDQEKLRPVSKPEVKLKKFVPYTELEFEAEFETLGPIKLPDYKKIKLARKPILVSDDEVEKVLKSLRQRAAKRKSVARPAKVGDEVVIDFSGKDKDGKVIPNTDGKDISVIIGSGLFIPGFEDNLVGLKAGDKKDFLLVFPNDYGVKSMQSKPVTFSVTLKKVSEVDEPKADNKFAAQAGPFKTLTELKVDIKKQLTAEKQQQIDRDYENEVIKKIVDRAQLTVPETLVDEQIKAAEEEEKRNLAMRGQNWEDHLKEEGITEDQHHERQRPDAQFRVKAGLVLSEIAEKEKIELSQEELELRIQVLKGQYKDEAMQAELDKEENRRDIASRLMTEKTVAKVIGYASQ